RLRHRSVGAGVCANPGTLPCGSGPISAAVRQGRRSIGKLSAGAATAGESNADAGDGGGWAGFPSGPTQPPPRAAAPAKPLPSAAVQALQNGANVGFDDIEQINKTSELEPLRVRPDFQQLVGDLKAKSKRLVWVEDFNEAKDKAAKEGKDLFIYFGGADWATF